MIQEPVAPSLPSKNRIAFTIKHTVISLSDTCRISCAAANRCLDHCWLDDAQREQGERCLVACWQSLHHADQHPETMLHPDAAKSLPAGQLHPCHSC